MKIQSIIILLLIIMFAGTANAERLAVSAPVANIRSGPGTGHNVLWKVERYFPLLVIQKSGAWYRFQDFEGDKGWVHASLVAKIPAVITRNDACNIRSGPGTSHNILFSVEKGIPFKVLKREGSWIHIEHADGDKGWIHKSLVW
jgi:SH3-like domain-containing protein